LATTKDKLLASAQKNLKKKQLGKAIEDYAKIVERDPVDIRSRQKLAELYVRNNRSVEAYEQYESIAQYFSANGFYLKAIAIYKQMQRLDSSQITIFNRLAELNEKQGLIGNAMTEYRHLVDYYGRNGMIADEIKILEKMRDLDPKKLKARIKLIEVLAGSEREGEGYAELESVLEVLRDKGDFDNILKIYKMFLPLYPNNKKMEMGLASAFYEKGDFDKGVAVLEKLLKGQTDDPDLLRLLGRGYADSEKWTKACTVYQQLADMDPTDLDIREALIKSHIGDIRYDVALAELEEWKDTFFKAERLESLTDYYETLKTKLTNNKMVLQTLDSIYELSGEGDKLLDIISEREEDVEGEIESETLSDVLLGSAEEDIDDSEEEIDDFEVEIDNAEEDIDDSEEQIDDFEEEIETIDESDDLVLDLVEDGELDLQSELPRNDDSEEREDIDDFVELEVDNSFYLGEEDGEITEFSFDLEEEVSEELGSPATDFEFESLELDEVAEKKIFKTDVDEQIAADDMESHYNLGIAYREMGLFDDAISEFEKAECEPTRFVDCQTMKGLSYSDKGDFEKAELMFQQALDFFSLETGQRLNLYYELGLLYEQTDRSNDALGSYQEVSIQDNNYRDVREKISQLKNVLGIDDGDAAAADGKERVSFL